MKTLLVLLSLLTPCTIHAKFYKVAIVDTGLDLKDPRFQDVICKDGHWDFVTNSPSVVDEHGHGTHVAGLIKKYAKDSKNYCLLIYRYYAEDGQNVTRFVKAIKMAIDNGADFVNVSGGGVEYSREEYELIKTHPNVTFVVAAGNDGRQLNNSYKYFPASYNLPNEVVVGNHNFFCKKAASSNYGSIVKAWEPGVSVISTLPNGVTGSMTGTSQSTAIHTGKMLSGNPEQECPYSNFPR